jgi:hypothetical protein
MWNGVWPIPKVIEERVMHKLQLRAW